MRDGRTVFATRPDYTGHVWTADQTTHHRRFQQASAYARHASKTNPLYKPLSAGTKRNAYNLALADWFKPPVIHQIIQQAGPIRVNVTDNVQVTDVRVRISDDHGNILEQGKATQLDSAWWEYTGTAGGCVSVEAHDLAANVTRREL